MNDGADPEKLASESDTGAVPRLRPQAGEVGTRLQWLPHVPRGLEATGSDEDESDASPVARMVSTLLIAAIAQGAAEVQLETGTSQGITRVRVAGAVTEIARVPAAVQARLINRLKRMADIPYWRLAPQTGLIRLTYNGNAYNLQVRTTTAHRNDFLTLQIVEAARRYSLDELNVPAPVQAALKEAIYDKGMILLVGPPGSGKTTLAFSWLCHLHSSGYTVGTVEDLPSYLSDGLVQTYRSRAVMGGGIRERASSLIRQNLDVLFCGDLTDQATRDAAIESAQAGVLTVACVSAPSTVGALTQLVRWGEGRSRLGSVLSGLVLQTLAGTICPHCGQLVSWEDEGKERLSRLHVGDWEPTGKPPVTVLDGAGCDKCHDTGVSGRSGLFAFTDIDDTIRPLLQPDNVHLLAPSRWAQEQANLLLPATYDAVWTRQIGISEAERAVRPFTAAARRLM